jgi:hypothetical protein
MNIKMKNNFLSAIVPAIALMALNATATTLTNGGALTISWTVTQQQEANTLVSSTTNHTTKATNYVSTYKAKTATSTFANASLLKLLENSFNTTFAAGTRLATDQSESVYVVDKTGTNVVLDISPVLSVNKTTQLRADSYSSTVSVPKSGVTTTNITGSETLTAYGDLTYDDSSLTTADGTHSTFQFSGVSTYTADVNKNSGHANFSVQNGAGSGTIRDIPSLISKGTYSGSAKVTVN